MTRNEMDPDPHVVLHSTTVKTIWHKKSHVVFKDDIEVVSKTSSINKIPSRSTATYCVSNEILFGRQRSHPCQTKRVRRKHDFSWLIYGRIPRTKSRLGKNIAFKRNTVLFRANVVLFRKDEHLFFQNAILFIENEACSLPTQFCLSQTKFRQRKTKSFLSTRSFVWGGRGFVRLEQNSVYRQQVLFGANEMSFVPNA